jgi:hypothetical protein
LAELDALFLTLNLPSSSSIKAVTYGTPRVGNAVFAQLIDAKVCNGKISPGLTVYQEPAAYVGPGLQAH